MNSWYRNFLFLGELRFDISIQIIFPFSLIVTSTLSAF